MKYGIFGIGLVTLLAALPALGEVHVQLGGGGFKPTGDSARFLKNGYRAEAGLEWSPGSNLALVVSGAYNRNKVDGAEIKQANSLPASFSVDGEAHIIELTFSPKFYLLLTESINAYVIGGVGPRWLDRKTVISRPVGPDIVKESNKTSLGFQLGFGVEAAISGSLKIGLSPGYQWIYDKDSRRQYATGVVYLKL